MARAGGQCLAGLAKEQHIDWSMPDGRRRRLHVVDIAYPPEAAEHDRR